ncbi:MAG: DUF655 domain-containing protein, partial [Epsilonproteobacteria bacterium]|nr:DUF655 domain-containing protein [Campylobacterota bacterium]
NERLKPTNFEDIIAVLALYRPGPMESGMLDDFVERKHGRAKITYMFDELEPILKPTYGVIVYQEQVMQIVQTIGGFSLGGADVVRRAMGKKIKSEMDRLKGEFADGAVKKGFDRKKAEELFDLIVKFAGYGFNKSHSAAYAMITFQTSYLKAYYPQEFMAALLTSEQDNTDKIVKYVDEVKRLGIKLAPPDIKKSFIEFSATKDGDEEVILFGLGAIKGVGKTAIKSIIKAREEKQFESLSDFISRVDTTKVNKKVLESLIKSGSLDCFGYSRRALLENIEHIVSAGAECARAKKMAENSLFGDSAEMVTARVEIEDLDEFDPRDILDLEKETMGFYISGHPLDSYREEIEKIPHTLSSDIDTIADGSEALFIGKVEEVTTKISKKGNKFGILNIMDFHGNIELTVFEKMLNKLEGMDIDHEPLAFKVQVNKDNQFTRIRVMKIMSLDESKKEHVQTKIEEKPKEPIIVKINLSQKSDILDRLYGLVKNFQGNREFKLIISSTRGDVVFDLRDRVDESIINEISNIEGVEKVA